MYCVPNVDVKEARLEMHTSKEQISYFDAKDAEEAYARIIFLCLLLLVSFLFIYLISESIPPSTFSRCGYVAF